MLQAYKIKNLERKERKELEKELYTVFCCARSWHNRLVKGSCCVCERNRKIQEKKGKRYVIKVKRDDFNKGTCTIVKISLSRMHGNENSQPLLFPVFIEKTINYKKNNLDKVPY